MPTRSILVLPRRDNNSWPAGLTKADVSPSVCTPLSPSLFTPHQFLYSHSLNWSKLASPLYVHHVCAIHRRPPELEHNVTFNPSHLCHDARWNDFHDARRDDSEVCFRRRRNSQVDLERPSNRRLCCPSPLPCRYRCYSKIVCILQD